MTMHIGMKNSSQTPIVARKPVIKIIGLGGGGSNAVNRLVELGMEDIEFIAANTDLQALRQSLAPVKIQLGPKLTRGLGAGGNPEVGEKAAEESYNALRQALTGADMVFLTAGMGGGTGTGSIAVAARVAQEVGAVTVAVVTTPFGFEVGRRQKNAREGLAKLQPYANTLITVPNDRLLTIEQRNLTLDLAFQLADDVLRQGIQGITELVTQPGLINVDFAHIRQVMQEGRGALMSIGMGQGENKAWKAIEQALHHPLLDSICIENATGIIANFTGGSGLGFLEVMEAMNHLQELTNHSADIIPGVINNPRMDDRAQVILVITGLGATPVDTSRQAVPASQPVDMPAPVPQNIPVAQPAAPQPVPVMQSAPANQPAQVPVRRISSFTQATPTNQPPARTGPSQQPYYGAQAGAAMSQPAAQARPPQPLEHSSITPPDIDLPAFMRRPRTK